MLCFWTCDTDHTEGHVSCTRVRGLVSDPRAKRLQIKQKVGLSATSISTLGFVMLTTLRERKRSLECSESWSLSVGVMVLI